jgi:hypothetical protein
MSGRGLAHRSLAHVTFWCEIRGLYFTLWADGKSFAWPRRPPVAGGERLVQGGSQ